MNMRTSIVEDARTRCSLLVAIVVVAATTACSAPADPRHQRPGSEQAIGPLMPSVTAVTFDGDTVSVWFDHAMDQVSAASATTLYRLTKHAVRDLLAGAEEVTVEKRWNGDTQLLLNWPLSPADYVVHVAETAAARTGRLLDGLSGRGVTGGLHRLDDDLLAAPSAYQSLVLHLGEGVERFEALPSMPELRLARVDAWAPGSSAGVYDSYVGTVWRAGTARVLSPPLLATSAGLRLWFDSAAGGMYGLPSPGGVPTRVALRDDNGFPVRIISVSMSKNLAVSLDPSQAVSAVSGLTITVEGGPQVRMDQFRNSDDVLWLIAGSEAAPDVVTGRIREWDGTVRRITLDPTQYTFDGMGYGTTVQTDRIWPAGLLDGGFDLVYPGGRTPVLAATDTVLTVGAPVTAACTPCQVELARLEQRLAPGDDVLITSASWYVRFTEQPQPRRQHVLVVNEDGQLRSVLGTPFRDLERDGDDESAVADDALVLELSFAGTDDPVPPSSRINDGSLYRTVWDAAALDCLGRDDAPNCVLEVAESGCPAVPAALAFSLYTADGGPGSFGTSDLVSGDGLAQDDVLIADGAGRLLGSHLETRTVVNSTSSGAFATTVIDVALVEREASGCLRGFQPGDRLRIRHGIETVAVVDPPTIDGDGDGLAEASSADDWIGVYDDDTHVFEPLVRHPRIP
ncbi:MAG: hypothetical protein D6761_04505 [Candidatus Dadabacteria bacterium]|nr:MAG: hypothetical protein D6761_04505 [Candidatus Dadabacteria bacterium]